MIKVLVVDDSALVRQILENGLAQDPEISVVGTAPDVYTARDLIVERLPDVLTLDLEMPRMDGINFLRRLMPQYPLPVVVVSALSAPGSQIALEALESGAVEVVLKPSTNLGHSLQDMMQDLREKIKIAAMADVSQWKQKRRYSPGQPYVLPPIRLKKSTDKVVAIGASTGGTVALQNIISALPADFPGTVVVQHMPPVFTRLFAERLNTLSQLQVKEAEHGEVIRPGKVLIAPGGYQTRIHRYGGFYQIELGSAEKVNGHCPSVDVLFYSMAQVVGSNGLGLLLTGMGKDGAEGLLAMRHAGARTYVQDRASSVVYGMPAEAWALGAAEAEWNLADMPQKLVEAVRLMEQTHEV